MTHSRFSFVFLLAAALAPLSPAQDGERVSVYCSMDAIHSEKILDLFTERTGIEVIKTFDEEENKTIGMVNKIISEKDNPRADVYWNNELGQTIKLKNLGLLQPYVSPNAATIPASFKDGEGYWTGFGARARVFIYNTNLMKAGDLTGLADLTDPKWKGKVTMARPIRGTTLTNVAALYAKWGEEKASKWIDDLLAADITWKIGNAQVMRDVAAGTAHWGFTDTDDARISMTRGDPTAIVVPDQGEDGLGVLLIPNSVVIVKGARHLENAKKFVDFLLLPEIEKKLAEGSSAQIPLHPGVSETEGVLRLDDIKAMDVDWEGTAREIEARFDDLHRRFEGGTEDPGSKALWFLIGGGVLAIIVFFLVVKKNG